MPTKVARALLVLAVGTTGSLRPGTLRAADPSADTAHAAPATPTAASPSDLQRLALAWQPLNADRRDGTDFFSFLDSAWFGSGSSQNADAFFPGAADFATGPAVAPRFLPLAVPSAAAPATDEDAAPLAASPLPADYAPTGLTSDSTSTATSFLPAGATAASGWTGTFSLSAAPGIAAASNPAVASPAIASPALPLPTTSVVQPDEQRFTRSVRPGLFTPHAVLPAATTATSGTLTGTTTAYNYSTAPWVITAGDGTYPDLGGVATFNPSTSITPGTLGAADTVTVDVSPTLSGITYNDPYTTVLAAGTSTSIIAATTGLTLNAANTATNSSTNFFTTFNTIASPISGGGTAGLTKTGSGIVTLTGSNTYTGGTHVNGGFLVIHPTAAVGDAVLGATGTGNDIFLNGGTLFTYVTGGLTTARNVILGSSGGTIETDTAATINGVVSGTGPLLVSGFGGVQLTLTNTNTYTGATSNSLSTAGYITLSGNGSIAASSAPTISPTS